MAKLSMWGPDPAKRGSSSASSGMWITPEELATPEDAASAEAATGAESDLTELAAKFSADSGGGLSKELSADLALEIVLNEIVEQACLATGATGAAIVLERDGELVCRASTGANAPELGTRLDTESGLSGECVRTHRIQRCDDAQSDPRADMEASRWLDVRSVMILPLLRPDRLRGDVLVGVFEVFSSRPSAFGERDERTLEALALRAIRNLQKADETLIAKAPEPPAAPAPPKPTAEMIRAAEAQLRARDEADLLTARAHAAEVARQEALHREQLRQNSIGEDPVRELPLRRAPVPQDFSYQDLSYQEAMLEKAARQFDGITLVLAAVVFACAVLLSMLVGLHFGRQATVERVHRTKTADNSASKNPGATNPANAATSSPATAAAGKSAVGISADTQKVAAAPTPPAAHGAPAGSLLIYENGKEVYRMLPSAPAKQNPQDGEVERASAVESTRPFELPSEMAESSLLHRVEPDYPEDARKLGIQGPVVLDLHIGKDGAVQEVGLVSGQPALVGAATTAVRQWRFKPHTVDGREVEMQTRITLRFTLPAS